MNSFASWAYGLSPIWAQNALLSSFSTLLSRQRYSGRYREFRDSLARTEWLSRTELITYQDERLRAIVKHAYETVPYYRRLFDEHGLSPADVRGRADLHKVPLLTKTAVRQNFADLRSRSAEGRSMRSGHTSGTTGTPLTVGYDRETVWITYAAFERHYSWAGLRSGIAGDRVAVARGNVVVPLSQRRPPYWRTNRALNQLLISSFHLSRSTLPTYVDALQRFRPTAIDGYPSTLYILARHLRATGRTFPVKAVITSSETLYDFQRTLIEDRFACKVFDYYALAERTVFSGECDHHCGHHVAMELGLAEVTTETGEPLPNNHMGKLVGSTLHNTAMPLIRYVTGDVSAIRSDSCACGRGLELMADVTTKAEDTLTLPDGRLISPSVLTHPFKPLHSIEGSQIVQTSPNTVEVRLVPGEGFAADLITDLTSELRQRLGEEVAIDVRLVDRLETQSNGKFKWVISHVPLGV
jgi:phenylacetate-CoA ligase